LEVTKHRGFGSVHRNNTRTENIDEKNIKQMEIRECTLYPSEAEAEDLNLYTSFCVWGFLCKLNKFCANSQAAKIYILSENIAQQSSKLLDYY